MLTDISSQNIFYLFLLESSFDYKLVITIYRTTVKENILLALFPPQQTDQIPGTLNVKTQGPEC